MVLNEDELHQLPLSERLTKLSELEEAISEEKKKITALRTQTLEQLGESIAARTPQEETRPHEQLQPTATYTKPPEARELETEFYRVADQYQTGELFTRNEPLPELKKTSYVLTGVSMVTGQRE